MFAILSLIAIDIVGYILQFSGPFTYLLRITTEKNPATLVATVQLILSAQFAFFVQSKLKVGGESQDAGILEGSGDCVLYFGI